MQAAVARMAPLAALAALAVLVAACAPAPTPPTPSAGPIATASMAAPASGTPVASAPGLVSPVTGVLTHIDAAGLAQVTGFTLRLDDGRLAVFRIGTLENAVEFPPGHLAEHLATSSPIRVFFRGEGLGLVVYRLEDAS